MFRTEDGWHDRMHESSVLIDPSVEAWLSMAVMCEMFFSVFRQRAIDKGCRYTWWPAEGDTHECIAYEELPKDAAPALTDLFSEFPPFAVQVQTNLGYSQTNRGTGSLQKRYYAQNMPFSQHGQCTPTQHWNL